MGGENYAKDLAANEWTNKQIEKIAKSWGEKDTEKLNRGQMD